MAVLPQRLLSYMLPWMLAGGVLFAGIVATWFYWEHTRQREQAALAHLFSLESDRIAATIEDHLSDYQVVMRGLQGFFRGSERINYSEFQLYTSSLQAIPELSGVQGLAFAIPLAGEDLEQHQRVLRAELPVDYRVTPEGLRDEMAPIIYIQPLEDANLNALGFDIFTTPQARQAAEQARDSGEVVITAPMALAQDEASGLSPSFVMYLPVYRVDAPLGTVDERRAALLGWVDVPFRMRDLIAGLAQEINPWVDLEITDRASGSNGAELYHSDTVSHAQRGRDGEMQAEHIIAVGTREWIVRSSSTADYRANVGGSGQAGLIPLTGGSMTLALMLVVFAIARQGDRSERRAVRLKSLYQALSETNQAIVRMDAEAELFPLVCRVAVEFGGMKMAWVGCVEQKGTAIVDVASFGGGTEYLRDITASIDAGEEQGRGPAGIALRENSAQIVNDFLVDDRTRSLSEYARKYSWRSVAAFPIQRQQKPFAVLVVYHGSKGAFDGEAINLLTEMSSDISFALDNFDREIQRREFEKALKESEARLSSILDNVGASIYLKDTRGRYTFVNQHALDILGLPRGEVIGHSDERVYDAHTAAQVIKNDRQVLEDGETLRKEEVDTVKSTGVTRTFWSVKMPLRRGDGSIYGLCGISTDITERKEGEDRIRYLSSYDALTGLPNRDLLQDKTRLALASAKGSGQELSLLCIDLDRFKIVNESLGHNVGDRILKELAQRLTAQLHLDATLCRLGADDFILLLPEDGAERAEAVARDLLGSIARPMLVGEQSLTVTATIGIASYPAHGRSFESLVQAADAALFQAKLLGRNTCLVFTETMRAQADEILLIENELRSALEKEQLLLHYQPKVDIQSGKIVGVEALVRWEHPQMGFIEPGRFIPVAEESGLIIEVDAWVMKTAARQLARWRSAGIQVGSVAINLSAIDLYHDDLCTRVGATLEENSLPPSTLELELTESIAMEHSGRTLATLGQLQAMGVSLSIDDFGTGYSSLSYLKRYPVHKLKIDRSFVDGLARDAEDQAIVKAIIGMARGLGFNTVAEGVETREQWEFLRLHGCDEYQGYYFSQALPAAELEQLLLRHPA